VITPSVLDARVHAGQAIYTKRLLALYDVGVLGISSRLIWKCPARAVQAHYNRHVTANHLDVGVGTGYFLDRCRFPSPTPRVALMDLNPNALEVACRRIARYKPETYRRNILEPISLNGRRFDSVGINFVLHCLPGSMASKSVALDHLQALMNPGGVLFGSTLLHDGVTRSWLAKRLMSLYNNRRIFSNEHDDLVGLRRALEQRFRDVSVVTVGCAALFSGRV
jgi:ubiquinone/menaquinone biosynthesis C-methylase UbiE